MVLRYIRHLLRRILNRSIRTFKLYSRRYSAGKSPPPTPTTSKLTTVATPLRLDRKRISSPNEGHQVCPLSESSETSTSESLLYHPCKRLGRLSEETQSLSSEPQRPETLFPTPNGTLSPHIPADQIFSGNLFSVQRSSEIFNPSPLCQQFPKQSLLDFTVCRISDITVSTDDLSLEAAAQDLPRRRGWEAVKRFFRRARNSEKWSTCQICCRKRKWKTVSTWIKILVYRSPWVHNKRTRNRLRRRSKCKRCRAIEHQIEYYRRRLVLSTLRPTPPSSPARSYRNSKKWTRATAKVFAKFFKSKIFKDLILDAVIKAMEKSVKR